MDGGDRPGSWAGGVGRGQGGRCEAGAAKGGNTPSGRRKRSGRRTAHREKLHLAMTTTRSATFAGNVAFRAATTDGAARRVDRRLSESGMKGALQPWSGWAAGSGGKKQRAQATTCTRAAQQAGGRWRWRMGCADRLLAGLCPSGRCWARPPARPARIPAPVAGAIAALLDGGLLGPCALPDAALHFARPHAHVIARCPL